MKRVLGFAGRAAGWVIFIALAARGWKVPLYSVGWNQIDDGGKLAIFGASTRPITIGSCQIPQTDLAGGQSHMTNNFELFVPFCGQSVAAFREIKCYPCERRGIKNTSRAADPASVQSVRGKNVERPV